MRKLVVWGLFGLMASASVNAAEYWTAYIKGVHTTTNGTVAVNIGSTQTPFGPNPAGSVWESCSGNWIYFHTDASGNAIKEVYIDRMLSTAISAFKTGTKVRFSISRSSSGKCYTGQIFDQG